RAGAGRLLPSPRPGADDRAGAESLLQTVPQVVHAPRARTAEPLQPGCCAADRGSRGSPGADRARAAPAQRPDRGPGAPSRGEGPSRRGRRVKPRIVICGTKTPFAYGGAEMLVDSLRDELKSRDFGVDVVALPFHWPTR